MYNNNLFYQYPVQFLNLFESIPIYHNVNVMNYCEKNMLSNSLVPRHTKRTQAKTDRHMNALNTSLKCLTQRDCCKANKRD